MRRAPPPRTPTPTWALAGRIADVPVYMIDERLSTVTAAYLREGGIDSRKQRPVIDQAAAVVILQQYLDSRQPSRDRFGGALRHSTAAGRIAARASEEDS